MWLSFELSLNPKSHSVAYGSQRPIHMQFAYSGRDPTKALRNKTKDSSDKYSKFLLVGPNPQHCITFVYRFLTS